MAENDRPYLPDLDDPDVIESFEPAPALWHYTSATGFYGIVRSGGGLKATDVRFLNDTSEATHGLSIARRVLTDAELPSESLRAQVLARVDDLSHERFLVASLSEECDKLSQWRFYADDAKGYCIKLQVANRLEAAPPDPEAGAVQWLWPCTYSLRKLRERILDRCRHKIRTALEHSQSDAWLVDEILRTVWRAAASTKNPRFREECEWRIVLNHTVGAIQYEVRGAKLVPFSYTNPAEIREVLVGPCAGGAAAVDAARGFLEQHGLADVEVREWEAPYRGR